jgi:hypothetical protein
VKHLADGVDFSENNKLQPCVACVEGRQSRKPFPTSANACETTALANVYSF